MRVVVIIKVGPNHLCQLQVKTMVVRGGDLTMQVKGCPQNHQRKNAGKYQTNNSRQLRLSAETLKCGDLFDVWGKNAKGS